MHSEIYRKHFVSCKIRNPETITPTRDSRNATSQPAHGRTIVHQYHIFYAIPNLLGCKNQQVFATNFSSRTLLGFEVGGS